MNRKLSQSAMSMLAWLFSSSISFSQGDVNAVLMESSINQALLALVDSRAINFAKFDGSYGVSNWNMNISNASVNLIGNTQNNVQLSLSLTGRATFNLVLFSFDVNINSSFVVYGAAALVPQGQGYKVILDPEGVSNFALTGTFLDNLVQDYINGFIQQIPEISFASYTSMLPGIVAQYFTSATPTLTITDDAAILSLTIAAGPRYITAHNEVNQQSNIGYVQDEEGPNNFVSYPSPKTFAWNTGTTQKLQTPDALLDASNGKNKYRNWFNPSGSNPNQPLTDIAPRRIQFTVGTQDATYKAKFDLAKRVQLSNLLEGSSSGGTVTYQYESGGISTAPTIDDYDFQSSSIQHPINTNVPNGTLGLNWIFRNWSDGNTNQSRTIIVNSDVNLVANYKAHLGSFSSSATAANNQRKIAQSDNGTFCLVYESASRIWFTKSADGANWSNEVEVGSASYIPSWGFYEPSTVRQSYPSMVIKNNIANIVWQWLAWDPTEEKYLIDIVLRRYNVTNNTWGPEETISTLSAAQNPNFAATPVIDAYSLSSSGSLDLKMIAWREPGGIKVRHNSFGTWGTVGTVSGTDANSLSPCIVNYNSDWYSIVWHNVLSQTIRYIEAANYSGWIFLNAEQVSPSGWYQNFSPSLAYTWLPGYKPTVVWQSDNNIVEGSSVHVRQRSAVGSGAIWGNVTSFSVGAQSQLSPAIGSYANNGKYSIVWSVDGTIYAASYNGSTWSGPSILGSGSSGGTGTSINAQTPSTLKALWKQPNGQIVFNSGGFINPGSAAPSGDDVITGRPALTTASSTTSAEGSVAEDLGGTPVPVRHNRHAIADFRNLVESGDPVLVGFELAGIKLNSEQTVKYSSIVDSISDLNSLKSDPFVITKANSVLSFSGAYYGWGFANTNKSVLASNGPLARVVIRSLTHQTNKRELWNVPSSVFNEIDGNSFGAFRSIDVDVNDFLGEEVQVEVILGQHGQASSLLIIDDYLILKKKTMMEASMITLEEKKEEPVPSQFALHQNYPNPFNPSTNIGFDLPTSEHVTIWIYDLLGKKILTVADGYFNAGRHGVIVEMSQFPSGVYLYRLAAGKFAESRRLLLVK